MSELRSLMIHALQQGVLPVTSECNTACLFCSHRYNPPGVKTYSFPSRHLSEIWEDLDLVRRPQSITIGESVTTLNEGEPLCHPELLAILKEVRRRFLGTPIKLTTNGILLTRDFLQECKAIGNMELTISLNSADTISREKLGLLPAPNLMGLLKEVGSYLPWHGSIVAMPHIVGEGDLANTMKLLCESGAATIRVLLPGFTRVAPPELLPSDMELLLVRGLAEEIQADYGVPVIVEPEQLDDFTPVVHGVIKGSPAYDVGLRGGEVILAVNDTSPRSRVHAFNLIEAQENPLIRVRSGLKEYTTQLIKEAGQKSGLVMCYDMSPMEMDDLLASVEEAALLRKKVLVLSSTLGSRLVSKVLERVSAARVYRVESQFFAGNIGAAGLLTVRDFARVLEAERRLDGALVILPRRAFDHRGRDVTGASYMTLESFGCRVLVI